MAFHLLSTNLGSGSVQSLKYDGLKNKTSSTQYSE